MSRIVFLLCFVGASMLATTAFPQSFLSQYKGLPRQPLSGRPTKNIRTSIVGSL
jgi:hypothetical protein